MKPRLLPPACHSDVFLIRIAPGDAGLFRYLLEGEGGHIAMLTVLDPKEALLKFSFSPHQRDEAERFLFRIGRTLSFQVQEWPSGRAVPPCSPVAAEECGI